MKRPYFPPRTWTRRCGIALLVLSLGVGTAWAQLPKPKRPQKLVHKAHKAFDNRDYARASKLFQEAQQEEEDPQLLFYEAVALQQQGRLEEASKAYTAFLKHEPESGGALNNLAQVHAALGNHPRAEHYFQKAMALNDPRSGFYAENHARYLDERGDWKPATEAWNQLIDQRPEADSPHRAMMERYLGSAPNDSPWDALDADARKLRVARGEEMAGYLWGRLAAEKPDRALGGALEALGRAAGWSPNLRRELLTVVAVSLARRLYDPRDFQSSETGRALRTLDDPVVREGAAELLRLHHLDARAFERSTYSWWLRGRTETDPPRGVWPADGFRALIRSLGKRVQPHDERRAAALFRLAADLRLDDVDPAAVSDLIALHVAGGRLDRVQELAQEYERRLFNAKNDAYRSSRLEKIFDYHRTLGGLYSLIGNWGSERDPTSAVYQLDRALHTFERLERSDPEVAQAKAAYTPELTEQLARSYAAVGRVEDSYRVRIEGASKLQKRGEPEAAAEVFAPIREAPPSAELNLRREFRSDYEVLTRELEVRPELERP